ncbi:hypothetical protein [Psychroflexus tropicus]|nr:hypothetical protein [Psychroflexus tropicus]
METIKNAIEETCNIIDENLNDKDFVMSSEKSLVFHFAWELSIR